MASPITSTIFQGLNDTGQNISNGVCNIRKLVGLNTSGAAAFIQFFDLPAANVTLGTTVPMHVMVLAATTGQSTIDFGGSELGWRIERRLSAFATTTATGNTGSSSTVYLTAWVV